MSRSSASHVISKEECPNEEHLDNNTIPLLDVPLPFEIRNMRIFMKMRQEDLAERLGVSRWTVRSWELGVLTPQPRIANHLRKLYEKKMGFDELDLDDLD